MKKLLTFLISIISFLCIGQTQLQSKIDSLQFTTNVASICRSNNVLEECKLCSSCGDVFFWEIIQGKDTVIPFLLDKILDTTHTSALNDSVRMKFRVGDIALLALQEIIHYIPTLTLAGIEFNSTQAYSAFWKHINHSYENRVHFASALERWYMKNKEDLI